MTSRSQNVNATSLRDHMFPQTTGRSVGSVDAKALYSRYLGAPNVTTEANPNDEQVYVARDLPDVYKNKRVFLRDSIEGFILENFEWYTFVLPWFVTNEMSVEMNIYRYNHVPAGPVPNKGIPRLITDSTSRFSDTVSRFGLAFMMEGDFMGTPEGDVQYMRSIMGISQGCQELINQSTIFAIMAAKNYYKEWQARNRRTGEPIKKIMQMEVDEFAILAHARGGFDKIAERRIDMMRHERAVPDSMIVFPGFPWHETMIAKGTATEYWRTGPDGVESLMEGPRSFGTWRNLVVYQTRTFHTHQRGRYVNPLVRDTCVGEVYPLVFDARRKEDYTRPGAFRAVQRNAFLYNVESDNYEMIEFEECLANSRFWHGRDYHPEVYKLLKKRNGHLARDKRSWKVKNERYSPANASLLDTQPGMAAGHRDELMLFGHDTENQSLFAAAYIGQLDLDVLPTADLMRMAQMLSAATANESNNSASQRAAQIQEVQKLVRDIEQTPYNENYFEALIAANIARSIDNNGRWVGERLTEDAPREFVPNKNGGLDLPAKVANLSFPLGFANYPGLKTFAEQGGSKGWGTAIPGRAKAAIDFIDQYANDLIGVNMESRAVASENTPEWFHVKTPGLAVFELIAGKRPPIFLQAPRYTSVTNRGVNEPSPNDVPLNRRPRSSDPDTPLDTLPDSIQNWAPVPTRQYNPNANVFIGTMPVLNYIALLTEARKSDGTADPASVANGKLNSYFRALTNVQGDFAEKEKVRNDLIGALMKRLYVNTQDPVVAYYSTDDVRSLIVDNFSTPPASLEDAKRLVASLQRNKRDLNSASKGWKTAYEALSEEDKARITNIGENLLKTRLNDAAVAEYNKGAAAAGSSRPARSTQAELVEQIGKALADTSDNEKSLMEQYRDARDKIDMFGRKYGNVAALSWNKLNQWAELVSSNENVDAADSKQLGEAVQAYYSSIRAMNERTMQVVSSIAPELVPSDASSSTSTLAAAASAMDEDFPGMATDATLGAVRAGGPKFFFRAPLTMSEGLLRSIASETDPAIRPADPRTGYRTVFNVWSAAQGSPAPREALRPIFERGDFLDVSRTAARKFDESSILSRFIQWPAVSDEEQGVFQYRAPQEFRGGYVEAFDGFDPTENLEDQLPRWDSNSDRFAAYASGIRKRPAAESVESSLYRHLAHVRMSSAEARREAQVESHRAEYDSMAMASEAPRKARKQGHDGHEFDALAAMRSMRTGGIAADDGNDEALFERMSSGGSSGLGPVRTQAAGIDLPADPEFGVIRRGAMDYRWKTAMKINDPVLRIAMLQLIFTPMNSLSAMLSLLHRNVNVPFNALVWRLWIEIQMYTMVIMKSGMDTGANVMGNTNFAMQTSTIDKVFLGHFTYYHKTMIWRDANISHVLDVFPKVYRAGWNLKFVKSTDELQSGTKDRGSIIVTLVPLSENTFEYPMSFIDTTADRILPSLTDRAREATERASYSTASFATAVWKISEERIRITEQNSYYHKINDVRERVNVLAYLGKHVQYNHLTNGFNKWVEGNGHLKGNKTGTGARSIWMGEGLDLLPQQTPSMYQLG